MPVSACRLDLFKQWVLPLAETYVPRAVDEVKGMADGAALPFEFCLFAAFRDGFVADWLGGGGGSTPGAAVPGSGTAGGGAADRDRDSSTSQGGDGCTAFACTQSTTASGGVVIGQTKDTGVGGVARYRVMKIHYTDTGVKHIVGNYCGWAVSAACYTEPHSCTCVGICMQTEG